MVEGPERGPAEKGPGAGPSHNGREPDQLTASREVLAVRAGKLTPAGTGAHDSERGNKPGSDRITHQHSPLTRPD